MSSTDLCSTAPPESYLKARFSLVYTRTVIYDLCYVHSLLCVGLPYHPDASRYWQIVDQFKVSKFYTAPTALRTLMKFGEKFVNCTERSSLKVLGTRAPLPLSNLSQSPPSRCASEVGGAFTP